MYIYVHEDGMVQCTDKHPAQDDLDACDAGILDIVHVNNGTEANHYYDGKFHPLDRLTQDDQQ